MLLRFQTFPKLTINLGCKNAHGFESFNFGIAIFGDIVSNRNIT